MKKLTREIEENDSSTDIVVPGLIKQFDRNVIDDIETINENLKRWCIGKDSHLLITSILMIWIEANFT